MVSVVVNGPASWDTLVDLDVLPDPKSHMVVAKGHRRGLGGTSAGKALGLARLGIPTTLHTVVGTDGDAELIRAALQHSMLTLIADVVPGPSEHHLNLMSADGGRVSIYLDVTGPPPEPGNQLRDALRDADIAVIDLTTSSVPILAAARDAGCEIWCDIHDYDGEAAFHRPFVQAADVLVVSADRLPDPRGFLAGVVRGGASLAVCTDGARGATALSSTEGEYSVKAVGVPKVLDTNGAGDAFVSALLAARTDRRPLPEALGWAAAAGAIAVQSYELSPPELTVAAVQRLAVGS